MKAIAYFNASISSFLASGFSVLFKSRVQMHIQQSQFGHTPPLQHGSLFAILFTSIEKVYILYLLSLVK
mgnify:CR=1 FL=1